MHPVYIERIPDCREFGLEKFHWAIMHIDHLPIEAIVGWFSVHFGVIKAPLYKDHLSTETTMTWSLEWLL